MLKWLRDWWAYSAYDENGMLKLLQDRAPDPYEFSAIDASQRNIQWTLNTICESFDINLAQQFSLRPNDNLADIYRAITKYRIGDDMEYERLLLILTERVGEFSPNELANDINVTVQEVIEFVSKRNVSQVPS